MKTFVTVTQHSSTQFDVEKVNAETQSRVRTEGVLITAWESNEQNDKYCFELAELMTKELANHSKSK
jgi:hypothetical protein